MEPTESDAAFAEHWKTVGPCLPIASWQVLQLHDRDTWHAAVAWAGESVARMIQTALAGAVQLAESSRPVSRESAPEHWKAYREAWEMRELVANEIAEKIRSLAAGLPGGTDAGGVK